MAPDCVATMSPCITPPLSSLPPKRRLNRPATGSDTWPVQRRKRRGRDQPVASAPAARRLRPRASTALRLPRCARLPLRVCSPPASRARRSGPCRLLGAWRRSSSERAAPRPPVAVSVSACSRCFCLEQQVEPLLFGELFRRPRRSALAASASIEAVTRDSSVRSAISTSVSSRSSGTTAPSRMALRTDDSASSGLTRIAGGGLSPMRCSAPSTSASTPRRAASDCADAVLLRLQRSPACRRCRRCPGRASSRSSRPGSARR